MYGCKPLGLDSLLSCAAQWPEHLSQSCFLVCLASCIPLLPPPHSSHCGVAASAGPQFWGALIHIWRPEITGGCDIPCLLIGEDIFISQFVPPSSCPLHNPISESQVRDIIWLYWEEKYNFPDSCGDLAQNEDSHHCSLFTENHLLSSLSETKGSRVNYPKPGDYAGLSLTVMLSYWFCSASKMSPPGLSPGASFSASGSFPAHFYWYLIFIAFLFLPIVQMSSH